MATASPNHITPKKANKPLLEQISLWTGVLGTALGLFLSVYAAIQKNRLDEAQQNLETFRLDLQAKAQEIEQIKHATEASRERVERYTWVRSLYADLDESDERKMNFTISLIRLALDDQEETQLFTALQASSNAQLRSAGQSGISAIEIEPIALLVNKIDAGTADIRKSAVATLVNNYSTSPVAVTLVLQLYEPGSLERLSPNGIINGLYFLQRTDRSAWNQQQLQAAQAALTKIEALRIGPQTQAAIDNLRRHLAQLPGQLTIQDN